MILYLQATSIYSFTGLIARSAFSAQNTQSVKDQNKKFML